MDYYRRGKRVQLATYQQFNVDKPELSTLNSSQAVFEKGLNQLSPKQNRLLHLVFYQNLTIQAAAEVIDIQIGTARTHYERATAVMAALPKFDPIDLFPKVLKNLNL